MILRPSYLHNGISYTGKMTYLHWIRAQTIQNDVCILQCYKSQKSSCLQNYILFTHKPAMVPVATVLWYFILARELNDPTEGLPSPTWSRIKWLSSLKENFKKLRSCDVREYWLHQIASLNFEINQLPFLLSYIISLFILSCKCSFYRLSFDGLPLTRL